MRGEMSSATSEAVFMIELAEENLRGENVVDNGETER